MASETSQFTHHAMSQIFSASTEILHDNPSSSHEIEMKNEDHDKQQGSGADNACTTANPDKDARIAEEIVYNSQIDGDLYLCLQISSFASPSASLTRLAAPWDDESQDGRQANYSSPSNDPTLFFSRPIPLTNTTIDNSKALDCSEESPFKIDAPSYNPLWKPRHHYFSIMLTFLSIFSTIGSGLYLGIALFKPSFSFIHKKDSLSISDATFLTAFIAKLIEVSFTTVFVSFVGQVVSRRAFKKDGGQGITLAEICMRSWLIDLGSIISRPETLKTGLFSVLGILAIVATCTAMLYTSAASALVSPQLHVRPYKPIQMYGLVKASFSNAPYIQQTCETPITDWEASVEGQAACTRIKNTYQSYFNYYDTYLPKWNTSIGESRQIARIPAIALLNEGTTVTAEWVDDHDVTTESRLVGRLIDNVSMAMPHIGVFEAAKDPINNMLLPDGTLGLDSFSLQASVPSPILYVMCANVSREELKPITYSEWPNAEPLDPLSWPYQIRNTANWTNNTVLDDIFGWNKDTGLVPPIFAKLPLAGNTLLNDSSLFGLHNAVFLLAKATPKFGGLYNLCSIKGGLTPSCSTQFNITRLGGSLGVNCRDTRNPLRYINSAPDSFTGSGGVSLNYPSVASPWARAIALNAGLDNSYAMNPKLLTQKMLLEPRLDPYKPSLSESLAVMAANTLLTSIKDAPFIMYWNYSSHSFTLKPGKYQMFNASIQTEVYASGGSFSYQKGFYIILLFAFLLNVLSLFWFLAHNGLVTDFCDLPNLFTLSINSPPSDGLMGSSAGGPSKEQYRINWLININGDHLFLDDRLCKQGHPRSHSAQSSGLSTTARNSLAETYGQLSRTKNWL